VDEEGAIADGPWQTDEVDQATTRERLLEHTIAVIDAEGVPAVRVHLIAEAAGVKVPSVYHFFGSKEGMIEAAQAERYVRSIRTSNARFLAIFASAATIEQFRDACREMMLSYCDAAGAHRRLVRLNALGSGYASPALLEAINAAQNEVNAEFAMALGMAQERGWVRADVDVCALAAWFMGQLLGRSLIEIGPSPVDPDHWNAIALEAIFAVALGPIDVTV